MYGCSRASLTVILFWGSKVSIFFIRSMASALAPLKRAVKSLAFLFGRLWMNSLFFGIVIYSTRSS